VRRGNIKIADSAILIPAIKEALFTAVLLSSDPPTERFSIWRVGLSYEKCTRLGTDVLN
jgi:hypothetical protein